ncbi:MAG: murein transglycosylase A [Saprospiraceae bacterium]|nr:murein transglycosylase A [Saprospiraceae bacterium]
MNIKDTLTKILLPSIALLPLLGLLPGTSNPTENSLVTDLSAFEISEPDIPDYMGRTSGRLTFNDHFEASETPTGISRGIIQESKEAFRGTKKILSRNQETRNYKVGDLHFESGDLDRVVSILEGAIDRPDFDPNESLQAYQISGKDNRGQVYYTGYFAPVIAVSDKKEGVFQYPLYRFPSNWIGKMPTREEIDGKQQMLEGLDLEIAYARNPLDIYFMQVQGSGYIEFPDGRQELLSYEGENDRRYRSIGKYMLEKNYTTPDRVSINSIKKFFKRNPDMVEEILFANPSYVFFKPGRKDVKGAGQVPLTKLHSIAVDPRYIPLGSVLLSKVPIANKKGEFTHHEYRLLHAHDTGGAIKGPGRIDIYSGVGYQGKSLASDTHHFGELWLLLPKFLGNRP